MPRRSSISDAATPIIRRQNLDLSLTGIVYFMMTLFMGLAAANLQANLLFGVFGLMIGVLLVAWVLSRSVLRRLRIKRILPEHAVVGTPVTLQYEFTNAKVFWPSLSVTLSEFDAAEAFTKQPHAYMLHAAPRTTANVPTELIPKRRGLHVFDRYQLSTSFPFGFIKRARDASEHETILIFPPIGKVAPKLMQMCRSADRSGATMRPRRGGDDEFYGVKEYRSGENPRSIYWRRSARTGVLVSKEMTQVSPPKLLLVVDTFLTDRTITAHANLERAIAMAASLASEALASGLMVGLYAWAGEWLGIHPNRGKRHRVDILAQLARLPLNTTHNTQAILDASRGFLKSGVTPILLTASDMPPGPTDPGRSNLIVVSAVSPQSQGWFTFEEEIDFTRCMPWDQQPTEEKREAGSAN